MPFVVRSDSENEAELVFLSPDEEPVPKNNDKKAPSEDQGASPVLRRSNRKRKSVTTVQEMSKNSGSKKKKTVSPDPTKAMPKIPRTPQQGQAQEPQHQASGQRAELPPGQASEQPTGRPPAAAAATTSKTSDFESLLLAMEARICTKIDATNRAVNEAVTMAKVTKDSLDALEDKVDSNDRDIREIRIALEDSERRIMDSVKDNIQELVTDQLRSAGFDPDLTTGGLSTICASAGKPQTSYALAAAAATDMMIPTTTGKRTQKQLLQTSSQSQTQETRREDRFWECRRTLRLWPVKEPTTEGLKGFLSERLGLDESFLNDLGPVTVRPHRDPRSKIKNEIYAEFESKEVRDAVKAAAPNLAKYREEAGMRLHIPNHLQKDFKALMSLSYDLKQRHPELRRNVKFDEEALGLFVDIQLRKDGPWKRVRPQQARDALATRKVSKTSGPAEFDAHELTDLLKPSDEELESQTEESQAEED